MTSAVATEFDGLDPAPVDIGFGSPRRQSRVTVAFRQLLVLPHVVVLALLTLVAALLHVAGWFAALFLGRLPGWIARFEMSVIGYSIRTQAYAFMLAGEFPPFSFAQGAFPVSIEISASRLSRITVFFRWLLVIPASIAAGLAGSGLLILSPVIWLVTLIRGQMPQAFFGATAAVVRFQARVNAYSYLVTDCYPRGLLGDSDDEWKSALGGGSRELSLSISRGARRLVVLMLVLGPVVAIGLYIVVVATRPGPPPPNPAVVAAEQRLENAIENSFAENRCTLRCERAHERSLGEAFVRFAATVSRVSFPRPQREAARVLLVDARLFGLALIAASESKDGGVPLGVDPADPADSLGIDDWYAETTRVFGRGPLS